MKYYSKILNKHNKLVTLKSAKHFSKSVCSKLRREQARMQVCEMVKNTK